MKLYILTYCVLTIIALILLILKGRGCSLLQAGLGALLAMTFRYGAHMSLHTYLSLALRSLPNSRKKRSNVFIRRSSPRHRFNQNTMSRAGNPAGSVAKEHLERPDRHIFEQAEPLRVIRLAPFAALRALRLAVTARLNVNDQCIKTADCCQSTVSINE